MALEGPGEAGGLEVLGLGIDLKDDGGSRRLMNHSGGIRI